MKCPSSIESSPLFPMKTHALPRLWMPVLVAVLVPSPWVHSGPEFQPVGSEVWRYQLLGPSTYLNECPPCGRPSILQPLRGHFDLSLKSSNPLFTQFQLTDIRLNVGGESPQGIQLIGTGDWTVGGEVALTQSLKLHLVITGPGLQETVDFESATQPFRPDRLPLQLDVVEVKPSPFRVLHLSIDAQPLRALWFSTAHSFTAAWPGPKPTPIRASEVLDSGGRVVVSQASLANALGLAQPPPETPWNLDAFTLVPGKFPWVSFASTLQSPAVGTVHPGDVVDIHGTRVAEYAFYGGIIGPEPPTPDLGLDALQVLEDGSQLFSTAQATFSERLGITVGTGDIVATTGKRWRDNRSLLRAFRPLKPEIDYGLDAFHVWPDGEIWFSTENDVELEGFQRLSNGDVLSDTGRVIYRNLELVQPFSPLEDVANFGLDALEIVTDVGSPSTAPNVESISAGGDRDAVVLQWTGAGRAYQIEQAPAVEGPFTPVSGILPGYRYQVEGLRAAGYFRIRQW